MVSAFPVDQVEAIVAWHNIAGDGGVLSAATEAVGKLVGDHYAARAIDQIPYTSDKSIKRYVLTSDPQDIVDQAFYRSQLSNIEFTPLSDPRALIEQGIRRAMFVPYIRLIDQPLPDEIDWIRYGLPPQITALLKNKADFHRWLMTHGFEKHVPNYVICDAMEIPERGVKMLQQIDTMYRDAGLYNKYPLGIMIRGAQCDGNYGIAFARQVLEDEYHGDQLALPGQIILKRDGNGGGRGVFDKWEEALEAARDHISYKTDLSRENKVVMTRLIQLRVSPGMAAVAQEGVVHPLGFNGQYIRKGETACIGTSSFRVSVGAWAEQQLNEQFLAQSQQILCDISDTVLRDLPERNQINAMFNIDYMIVDELEAELWKRINANPDLHHYLDNMGRCDDDYAPYPYAPDQILIAEMNPRDTNWTLAMKAVIQSLHLPCTLDNLQMVGMGQTVKVIARDRWPLPHDVGFGEAREKLLEFHQKRLAPNGEGFILRMADYPAGVMIYTPSDAPDRAEQISLEAERLFQRG